jgi:hypothetical protein
MTVKVSICWQLIIKLNKITPPLKGGFFYLKIFLAKNLTEKIIFNIFLKKKL